MGQENIHDLYTQYRDTVPLYCMIIVNLRHQCPCRILPSVVLGPDETRGRKAIATDDRSVTLTIVRNLPGTRTLIHHCKGEKKNHHHGTFPAAMFAIKRPRITANSYQYITLTSTTIFKEKRFNSLVQNRETPNTAHAYLPHLINARQLENSLVRPRLSHSSLICA